MGYIGYQIHPQLVAARHLLKTLFLNLHRLLKAYLLKLLHMLRGILHNAAKLLMPKGFDHILTDKHLNQKCNDYNVSCPVSFVILPPQPLTFHKEAHIPGCRQPPDASDLIQSF